MNKGVCTHREKESKNIKIHTKLFDMIISGEITIMEEEKAFIPLM